MVFYGEQGRLLPGCQIGGRILADRALSRLLRDDWPRTLEELERVMPVNRTRNLEEK
ncbi:MAG: hypothetical protein ACM3X6_14505 [Patescibacteria group bacterium]